MMSQPKVVAAVDVGSNSIRLLVAEVNGRGRTGELDRLVVPVMIGRDTFSTGRISNRTMRETADALKGFARTMKEYGVSHYRAIATSAVREALNRDTFLDSVETASGLTLQVVEPIEETRLVHQVIRRSMGEDFMRPGKTVMVLALGAGSAEITVFHEGKLIFTETGRIGTLRLMETLASDASERLLYQRLSTFVINVASTLERVHRVTGIDTMVVVNTEMHDLLERNEFKGARRRDDLITLNRGTFGRIVKRVSATSVDERVEKFGLGYDAAETLYAALVVTQSFLETTKSKEIVLPSVSVLDSLLLDVISGAGPAGASAGFEDDVVASAIAIGRKYHFDEAHSLHVEKLAMMLYDRLEEFCGLKKQYRLLLRVAAILHDIGIFVSTRSHHKHSHYLVMQSEILGISEENLRIIAQAARYHRRATPRVGHVDYWALPQASRVAVSKIASILRIADALDRNHSQEILLLNAVPGDEELVIEVKSKGTLLVDEWALETKADLFKEVFGLSVVLSRAQ